MSAKKPPPTDEDFEEDFDYVEGDEGDDDEADFVPGEDDDEDDDDVLEEEEIVPLFHGTLSIDQDKILHWIGEGFHLTSVEAIEWNILDQNVRPPWAAASSATGGDDGEESSSPVHTMQMEGHCDIETGSGNPTHRKMEVTWSLQDPSSTEAIITTKSMNGSSSGKAGAKKGDDDDDDIRGDDDDDDDAKKGSSKMPSLSYRVYGRQLDTSKGEILEFRGAFAPNGSEEASLVCQVRVVASKPAVMASPVAAAASPAGAKAARVDTDDDDIAQEVDDGVHYDELIALHEDAGLSVDALRKRYRGGGDDDDDDDDNKKEASSPDRKKRGKPVPDDEDDDVDYSF